jgi:hypothetical protein
MLRRLVIAGLAAALIAPLHVTSSTSATVLFTCAGVGSWLDLSPGWSHTQTAQSARGNVGFGFDASTECDNGEYASIWYGEPDVNAVRSFPPRPIGCPVAWGGAGPDYPDRTPILVGDAVRSFKIIWWNGRRHSNGVASVKAGPAGDQYRFVFSITTGEYAPPSGQKTRIRFTARIVPSTYPGVTYTCADDSDPLEEVDLESVGPVIVTQK